MNLTKAVYTRSYTSGPDSCEPARRCYRSEAVTVDKFVRVIHLTRR
jgi:hypothetical protein